MMGLLRGKVHGNSVMMRLPTWVWAAPYQTVGGTVMPSNLGARFNRPDDRRRRRCAA